MTIELIGDENIKTQLYHRRSVWKLITGAFSRYFIKIPVGLLSSKKLFPDKNINYLVICDHIGDFLLTMGYLNSFKAIHKIEKLKIYVTPKMEGLARRYIDSDDQIVCLSRHELDRVLYLNTSHYTTEWVRKRGNLWLMEPAGHFNDKDFEFFLYFPRMTLRQLIQYGCLHLPESAVFTPLPVASNLTNKEHSGGRIILCPYAQGSWLKKIPYNTFESLAKTLINHGKKVFTNLAVSSKDEEAIQGTQPIQLTLEEFEKWIYPDDLIIGLRSGLMDFAAYLGCNIICLYPCNTRHMHFYSLDMLPQTKSRYVEYEQIGVVDKDVENILEMAKILYNKK